MESAELIISCASLLLVYLAGGGYFGQWYSIALLYQRIDGFDASISTKLAPADGTFSLTSVTTRGFRLSAVFSPCSIALELVESQYKENTAALRECGVKVKGSTVCFVHWLGEFRGQMQIKCGWILPTTPYIPCDHRALHKPPNLWAVSTAAIRRSNQSSWCSPSASASKLQGVCCGCQNCRHGRGWTHGGNVYPFSTHSRIRSWP